MKPRLLTLLMLMLALAIPACDSGGDGMSSTTPGGNTGGNNGGNTGGDNGGDNGGNTGGGDDTITFSGHISSIFSSSCSGSACHIGMTTNGVNLSSYTAVINSMGTQYGGPIVIPGNAAGSPLVNKISSSIPQFGVRMPKDSSPLSTLDITRIRTWIDDGAPNN